MLFFIIRSLRGQLRQKCTALVVCCYHQIRDMFNDCITPQQVYHWLNQQIFNQLLRERVFLQSRLCLTLLHF